MKQRIKPLLDLIDAALKKRGVTLKRADLVEFAAEAFNFHNSHELTAAVERGAIEITSPSPSTTQKNEIVSEFAPTPGPSEFKYLTDLYGNEKRKSKPVSEMGNDEIEALLSRAENPDLNDTRLEKLNNQTDWLNGKELSYLGYDFIVVPEFKRIAHLGYSAFYKDRKYYAPTIEIDFEEGGSFGAACTDAEYIAKLCRKNFKKYKIDGHVFIDHNTGSDGMRHEVVVLIPVEVAGRTENFNEWKLWLILDLFTNIS